MIILHKHKKLKSVFYAEENGKQAAHRHLDILSTVSKKGFKFQSILKMEINNIFEDRRNADQVDEETQN